MRASLPVALLAIAGCSSGGVGRLGAGELTVSPSPVRFAGGWVGYPSTISLEVKNGSAAIARVPVGVSGPFSADAETLEVPGGASSRLTIAYLPPAPGHHRGQLALGALAVALEGDAQLPPNCAPAPCATAAFDPAGGACASTPLAEGTACHSVCTRGFCEQGECVGAFEGCDDANPCTVDLCSEANGCAHAPLQCPAPADPCQVAFCDPAAGCGEETAPDGTACAPEQCSSAVVAVCVSGRCVERPRAVASVCPDSWSHPFMLARVFSVMAYDSARDRLVLFGGGTYDGTGATYDETWEWNASRWEQRFPVHQPAGALGGAIAYDSSRGRTVLFGADVARFGGHANETWEWDGSDWSQVATAHSPPARGWASLVFDSGRDTMVLFGGEGFADAGDLADTWEYDGSDWVERFPAHSPGPMRSAPGAYDPVRRYVALYQDSGDAQSVLWEWDGTDWTQANERVQSPPTSYQPSLYFDRTRGALVMLGAGAWEWDGSAWTERKLEYVGGGLGVAGAYDEHRQWWVSYGGAFNAQLADTWVYDGTRSSRVTSPEPAPMRQAALVEAGQRTLLFGFTTDPATPAIRGWEWSGTAWTDLGTQPSAASSTLRLSYDARRQVVVAFGGSDGQWAPYGDQTWEWDGAQWARHHTVHSPPARADHALAYDAVREVTVVFGGMNDVGALGDTWEYDGHDWTEITALHKAPPPRAGAAMTYDPGARRMLLFGGYDATVAFGDTWSWDGQRWSLWSTPVAPAARYGAQLVYDETSAVVRLFGGDPGRSWDTWEWDGAQWSPATAPPPAVSNAASFTWTFDRAHQQVVGYGQGNGIWSWVGLGSFGPQDTWVYTPP